MAHVRADRGLGNDGDIELAIVQHSTHDAGVADEHRCLDVGIALLETTQQIGQADEREAFVQAQSKHALQRIARMKAFDHFTGRAEQPVRVFDQRMTLGGQRDARTPANEQRGLELGLELANPLRHARLAQSKLASGGVETPETNDALERPQLS